jgi:hypothetical protein
MRPPVRIHTGAVQGGCLRLSLNERAGISAIGCAAAVRGRGLRHFNPGCRSNRPSRAPTD